MSDTLTITLDPPGDAKLSFLSMEGSEELSRLYEYSVIAVARPDAVLTFEKLLGKPAQVKVEAKGKPARFHHGLVTAMSYEGPIGDNLAYRLTLRPWLWLATRAANVRIFQPMTVPDILKKVFQPYGGLTELHLTGTYRKREYCVQYRESDFNFASRLMEEEGIYYWFVHADGKHTMVLADNPSAPKPLQGLAQLSFRDINPVAECVTRWRWSEQIQTNEVMLRDHSFMLPTQTFEKEAKVKRTHDHVPLKAYDYPAGLATYPEDPGTLPTESEALAKVRAEEQQARYALVDGDTNSVNLCTGARFKLTDRKQGQDGEYIVLSTRLRMRYAGYEGGASGQSEHHCQFAAFSSKIPFRPARISPKPTVAGPQTATVVGKSGEEIHVDKYGRVKLQFHWDRDGKKDEKSSCYVRVAQPSAGKGWGMVFLPRVGQEVVVDFLEGDPDQPLVTGRVYNADNMPPYTLPDKKTVSTIKSRSSKGGGAKDFNELRFDDLKGSEYLLMQSKKDKLEFVGETVKTQIGKEQHHIVKADRKEKVEGEYHLTVVKGVKQKFSDKYSLKAGKDILIATDGAHNIKAAKDVTAESGTAYSIKAGTDLHVKAGKNVGVEGGVNVHIKAGVNVVIEGGMQLTIKAGAGSVVLGPDGVSITGPMVKINSGGSPGSGNGASPVAPTAPEAPADPEAPKDPLDHI
jgi:type VI secretion system secreted protein VgrG